MNVEIFAEWLRGIGHRVIQSDTSYWYDQGPSVFQAFPYHWEICPTENELSKLFSEYHAVGLRYSTPLRSAYGAISYHTIMNKSTYQIDDLGKKTRKNIRRGLKTSVVMPISFSLLSEDGWSVRQDTLDRQGRSIKRDQAQWRRRCLKAGDLPGFEAWGAFIEKQLAAALITFQMDDTCYILEQYSVRKFLPENVNNAISYTVTKEMIAREPIQSIFYGLHSLDAPASLDQFKFHMGYSAKPVRQRVVFHPRLKPIFNKATHALLKHAHNLKPGSPFLAKTEGMVRFFLQGMKPIDEQPLPTGVWAANETLFVK